MKSTCYHCGDECGSTTIRFDEKTFCCNGCKAVFEIFSSNDLSCYYDLQQSPGAIPREVEGKYDFLDNTSITEKLLEFDDGKTQIINLYIPHIHCSSCIWVLENLNKLNPAAISSQVNFGKKTVRISFSSDRISLKELVLQLSGIGYEPYISLEDYSTGSKKISRDIIYKLGVAGFAFGNVMFLSFPEYFEVNEYWLEQYKHLFRWLMFAFSVPTVFYSGKDYFISAYKGLRSGLLNIDVPIALGISVLFIRSTAEIIFDLGSGFFDSLTGLIFFLLLGRFFQQKTYAFLSFERDYRSYFPIAITKIDPDKKEESIQVYDIKQGDRLLIRNEELIPVDGILINGNALVDYSFVTGESNPVQKSSGEKLFAGGKQLSGVIEMEALKSVEQSYLTQLWSNDVFSKDKTSRFQTLTDSISKRFTIAVLAIAAIASLYWMFADPSKVLNVFTAVLIIACPCAIALASPFTLGNLLRILGKKKFYLKNASVIEQLAKVDTIIFDKTGTITTNNTANILYEGNPLSEEEAVLLKSTLRASNHPLSRQLYELLAEYDIRTLDDYKEYVGKGLEAHAGSHKIKVGSAAFVEQSSNSGSDNTAVHISADDHYKGQFIFHNEYRQGLPELFNSLDREYELAILSGDNEGEKAYLQQMLPVNTSFHFNRKPDGKLEDIKSLQQQDKTVMMIGDGLNDAGALAQSDVGVAISEDVNVFSPACDAILDASKFRFLPDYIKASKKAIGIIKWSFLLSLIYNITGLYFAVTGQLQPVIAAILMPLSSISIVVFTTLATNMICRKMK
ncbi:HAD-IC family P-type ATPase [Leptobacterium flavescens]|uniref:HAD-IC family P-type ATPase n=1 Tax=Leptobacterium flavescens TaxID=472055 RepID=A0A6P0UN95_9FLAO|nr:heavy metal translocating P-type ATPase metal-binding domain-containing protein [Leptobacterium flavescens]NER14851.1 HAD-IC family P-type ATPase [Leptobacterium flavescens]